jgi:hypothetical protein
MKLTITTLIMSVFYSCSSNVVKVRPSYEVINEIWKNQGNAQDVQRNLGKPDIIDSKKAEYFFPDSKVPQMHFEFSQEGKLQSALLFLDESKIDEFKSFLDCHWSEKKGKKQIADAIYMTHEGRCEDAQVRFNYFSSLHSYEIWWDLKPKVSK